MYCFGLAAEKLPIGDATVILMLSAFVAALAGLLLLKERWMLIDFVGTVVALIGASLVGKIRYVYYTLVFV